MAKSISWSQTDWACISLAEDKTKGRKTHKQTTTEVKAWQSITKKETQSLVMFMSSDLRQPLPAKDSQHNIKNEHFMLHYQIQIQIVYCHCTYIQRNYKYANVSS